MMRTSAAIAMVAAALNVSDIGVLPLALRVNLASGGTIDHAPGISNVRRHRPDVESCAVALHLIALVGLALLLHAPSHAQEPSPFAIDIPSWFVLSFLDLREDVAEAASDGKRLLVYFGQDGCPYCAKLMSTNFAQRSIVEKTRKHFLPVALNLWGDRELTWIDGRRMTEKELGRTLDVQFTPTLLFFDEAGKVVVRLNGYWPPQRFEAVLDYVAGRREKGQPLADYLAVAVKGKAAATLHEQAFFVKPPYDLRRAQGARPLAVLFETVDCAGCDELHREAFRRAEVRAQLRRFDVARFAIGARTELVTPAGRPSTAQAFGRDLGRDVRADHRSLRRRDGGASPGVLPASPPRGRRARLRGKRRVPQRALVSALHSRSRRRDARPRRAAST